MRSRRCWEVIQCLSDSFHLRRDMNLIGCSAGCLKSWSMILAATQNQTHSVKTIVSICGAWHPTVCPDMLDRIANTTINFLVRHHTKDSLCPWPGALENFMSAVRHRLQDRFYQTMIDSVDVSFVGKSFHGAHKLLCSMQSFWSMLLASREFITERGGFCAYCKTLSLGQSHLVHPSELIESDVSFCPRNQAYSVLAAYLLLKASSYATQWNGLQVRSAGRHSNCL